MERGDDPSGLGGARQQLDLDGVVGEFDESAGDPVEDADLKQCVHIGCPAAFLRRLAERHPQMQLVAMLNPGDSDWRQAIDGKLAYLLLVRLTSTAELLERALMIAAAIRALPHAPEVRVNLICISSYTHDEVADLL